MFESNGCPSCESLSEWVEAEWLKRTITGSILGIWEFDRRTSRLKWSSDAMSAAFALEKDVPLSLRQMLRLVHEMDRKRLVEDLRHIRTRPIRADYVVRWGDAVRLFHFVAVLFDEAEERYVGFVEDVTHWRDQFERLREIEKLYEQVSANAEDIISVCDPNGIFTYVSPSVFQVLGYEPEELVGQLSDSYFHPDDLEVLKTIESQLTRDEGGDRYCSRVRTKQGNYVWIETTLRVIRNEQRHIEYLIGVGRDVTERMSRERRVEELKAWYEYILAAAGDGIVVLDMNGRCTYVNDAACKMLGYTCHELEGVALHDKIHFQYEDGSAYASNQCPLLAVLHTRTKLSVQEEVLWRKDGTPVPVQCSVSPLYQEGDMRGAVIVFNDVTDRKRSERELRESQAMLQKTEKLSVVGQLAAGIAHEIRNPLTALRGFTQLLYEHVEEKDRKHLQIMLSELDRIQSILGELLVISKPQATVKRLFPIGQVITDVLTLLDSQFIMKNIQTELSFPIDLPHVFCEPNQLKQVFLNIMKNAMEAMDGGGEMRVLCAVEGTHIAIYISDTGGGIPEEVMVRLGDPFFTTKDNGTGLGILMSQRIVDAHGGSLTFESVTGSGTTARIALPFQQSSGSGRT